MSTFFPIATLALFSRVGTFVQRFGGSGWIRVDQRSEVGSKDPGNRINRDPPETPIRSFSSYQKCLSCLFYDDKNVICDSTTSFGDVRRLSGHWTEPEGSDSFVP